MKPHLIAGVLSVLAFTSLASSAELPPGGTPLLPADAPETLKLTESLRQGGSIVDVAGQSFSKALQVTLAKRVAESYDAQATLATLQPVKKGDVLHARLFVRCVQSMTGSATFGVVFERNKDPFDKSLNFQYSAGNEWTTIDLPFVAKNDLPTGEGQLCIRLGFAEQTVQVGGIQLLNYGQGFDRKKLPGTVITYAGREVDAPWRKAAAERIDKFRKADLKITVKDAAGNAVSGAQVHVAMQRHEFSWGTCVATGPLLGNTPDDIRYRETLKTYFNQVVIENALKWVGIARNGYQQPDDMIAWLQANNFTIRGHNLIWPGQRFLPKQALDLLDKAEELRKLCDAHITEAASRYSGKLVDWDVVNEAYANHLIQDKLGNQEMARWFKLAKAADPKARMYINDYAILASSDLVDTGHQQHYFDTIKSLLDQGAPIEGIGMQGHFGGHLTSPDNLVKILDRFAALGLPIKVTELDLSVDDESLRADYMRDLTTVLFSHPAITGVLQWGFWEKAHWLPEAALFDRNWKLRPHGQAWVDLVHKQWKTDVTQATSATGQLSVRGFKGDYEITVTTADGKTTKEPVKLTGSGTDLTITLK